MNAKYKFAVELLISRIEEFIYNNDLDMDYKEEVEEINNRIKVVRKFENEEEEQ